MKRTLLGTPSMRVVMVVGLLMVLGVTAAMAFAAGNSQADGETLNACVAKNGNLRLVADSRECRGTEQPVSWNVEGPAGPPGPEGPQGPKGDDGGTGDGPLKLFLTDRAPGSEAHMAYLKFEDIDGEAEGEDHKGWIDLISFSQPIHTTTTAGSSRTAVRTTFEDIVVVKEIDKATPKLQEAIATGKSIGTVELDLTRQAGAQRETYLKYELKNVRITSYALGGSTESDEVPMEQLSLNFEEIKVTYTERDDDGAAKGNVEFEWKVEEGES